MWLIGFGLGDEKGLTIKSLDVIKRCDLVYVDNYTSVINFYIKDLEQLINKKVILANRDLVENKDDIIDNSKNKDVAFLVVGDVFSATTHTDLLLRAKQNNIKTSVIHNASILSVIAETGLSSYKFGKTCSIPFPEKGFKPQSFYDVIKDNKSINAHTLILLDLRPEEKSFLSINQAIKILLGVENKRKENVFTEETLCIGCARLGSSNKKIRIGKAKELLKENFGKPPFCLVVPAKLHFIEEKSLKSL